MTINHIVGGSFGHWYCWAKCSSPTFVFLIHMQLSTTNPQERRLALSASGIYKRFGATEALVNVNLDLYAGEVHCLVGENGAGKSTLAKIITGIMQPDRGTLQVGGQTVRIRNVNVARELGISAVYQHPIVFPDLSVTENVFAGRQLHSRAKCSTRSGVFSNK
jgi:ABC-type sugar transport system ATPase subunit